MRGVVTMSEYEQQVYRNERARLLARCGGNGDECAFASGGEPMGALGPTTRTLLNCVDALEKRIAALEAEARLIRDPMSSVVVGSHPNIKFGHPSGTGLLPTVIE